MKGIVDAFDTVVALIFVGSVMRFVYLEWFKKERSVRVVQLTWFSVIMALLGVFGDVVNSVVFGESWWRVVSTIFVVAMSIVTWKLTEEKFRRSLVS